MQHKHYGLIFGTLSGGQSWNHQDKKKQAQQETIKKIR